eukprot:Sdes_comp15051_c0_seq1m3825
MALRSNVGRSLLNQCLFIRKEYFPSPRLISKDYHSISPLLSSFGPPNRGPPGSNSGSGPPNRGPSGSGPSSRGPGGYGPNNRGPSGPRPTNRGRTNSNNPNTRTSNRSPLGMKPNQGSQSSAGSHRGAGNTKSGFEGERGFPRNVKASGGGEEARKHRLNQLGPKAPPKEPKNEEPSFVPDAEDKSFEIRKKFGHKPNKSYPAVTFALQHQMYEDFFNNPKYYTISKLSILYGITKEIVRGNLIIHHHLRERIASGELELTEEVLERAAQKEDAMSKAGPPLIDIKALLKSYEVGSKYVSVEMKDFQQYLAYTDEIRQKELIEAAKDKLEPWERQEKYFDLKNEPTDTISTNYFASSQKHTWSFVDITHGNPTRRALRHGEIKDLVIHIDGGIC